MAFEADGTLAYLFLGLRGLGNNPMGAFITTSSDQGRSFTAPRLVLGGGNYQVRMAIDRSLGAKGRIHLVWLRATAGAPLGGLPPPPNPILASHSDDGGATFSRPVQVSDPGRPYAVAPALAVGPDHSLRVLYYDLERDAVDYLGLEGPTWDGLWSLLCSVSSDAGDTFGPSVVVDDRLVPAERVMLIYTMPPPALAVDRSGRIFAAWDDARNGDRDVFLRVSVDEGRSWGPLHRINDDAPHDGRHQYLPQLSTAPNGRLDVIFYDRRRDPENVRNDISYTYSVDGGGTFAPNLRITPYSSDPRHGQSYLVPSARGLIELGSRIGLWSEDHEAVAAWTDTRNSRPGSRAQDIFARVIDLPDPGGSHAIPFLAGALLSAASGIAVAAAVLRWRRTHRLSWGASRDHGDV